MVTGARRDRAPDSREPPIRPNQIIAVGLRHRPLGAVGQRNVVRVCRRHLHTACGSRPARIATRTIAVSCRNATAAIIKGRFGSALATPVTSPTGLVGGSARPMPGDHRAELSTSRQAEYQEG